MAHQRRPPDPPDPNIGPLRDVPEQLEMFGHPPRPVQEPDGPLAFHPDGALFIGLLCAAPIERRKGAAHRGSPGWHCHFQNGAQYQLAYGNWERVWSPIKEEETMDRTMENKRERKPLKAQLVDHIQVMVEVQEENASQQLHIAEHGGGARSRGYAAWSEDCAERLRSLIPIVAGVPDDDERVRRIEAILAGAEVEDELLERLFDCDEGGARLPVDRDDLNNLLDDLEDALEEERRDAE